MSTNVAERITGLQEMSKVARSSLWRELFGTAAPPRLRRELMVRILAHRIQEQASGGLKPSTCQRLHRLARSFENHSRRANAESPEIKPGTRLLRHWRDRTHVVTVVEQGYEYQGARYPSLSAIARQITGTRWSGPLFFGLKPSQPEHPGAQP